MKAYDLSILIPARNEQFLSRTVEDILANKRGKTEVIVVLDGAWAEPGIKDHPDVTIIYHNQSIGQRAATNEAAKISKAKYVAKTDGHCSFDEGFDVKLMADMQDDWTVVPTMKNLHAFDWVCPNGHRRYQGPSGKCKECGLDTKMDIVWRAKPSPNSTSYTFDQDLHFQYFKDFEKRPEGKGQLTESMSLQGSFFMCTREKYWELGLCDEAHGSWGQQGVEVALKTWLSGGRVMVNKNTWYAHMFRTQGGDFGFPYPLSQKDVNKAREYSRNLWLGKNWPLAKYDLDWLLQRFNPVPWWHYDPKAKHEPKPKKGVVYYTDNRLDDKLMTACQKQIKKGIKEKHIVSVSLQPINFGKNIHLPLERGYLTMAKQILAGLQASDADIIFFCEHDVLYHPSHFDFIPPKKDVYYYNTNVWKLRAEDGLAVKVDDCKQLSGLCAYKDLLMAHYKARIARLEAEGYSNAIGHEPGTHNRPERIDSYTAEAWQSALPNIDIRHDKNATPSRWSKDDFRNERFTKGWTESNDIQGWGQTEDILKTIIGIK